MTRSVTKIASSFYRRCFGYHGYTFANLGEHEFVEEKTKVAKVSQGVEDGPDTKRAKLDSSETTMVKKKVVFAPLRKLWKWTGAVIRQRQL